MFNLQHLGHGGSSNGRSLDHGSRGREFKPLLAALAFLSLNLLVMFPLQVLQGITILHNSKNESLAVLFGAKQA